MRSTLHAPTATFALVILGGAHDLTESVRRHGGSCEYLRVTTTRYREVAGEE
jgi:hypothetical protein